MSRRLATSFKIQNGWLEVTLIMRTVTFETSDIFHSSLIESTNWDFQMLRKMCLSPVQYYKLASAELFWRSKSCNLIPRSIFRRESLVVNCTGVHKSIRVPASGRIQFYAFAPKEDAKNSQKNSRRSKKSHRYLWKDSISLHIYVLRNKHG